MERRIVRRVVSPAVPGQGLARSLSIAPVTVQATAINVTNP